LIKACAKCQHRKVRCDGSIPACGPCRKSNIAEGCNVLECILYTHDRLQALSDRVQWLESLVARTFEDGASIAGVKTGTALQPKPSKEYTLEPVVEEVGLLSLKANGSYSELSDLRYMLTGVGSMSGVTLCRLISSAIRLQGEEKPTVDPDDPLPARTVTLRASYPPRQVIALYVEQYLRRVHQWYPFLDLDHLQATLKAVYDRSTSCDVFGRFALCMLGALATNVVEDPNTPSEYFAAAMGFLDQVLANTDLNAIRALLLIVTYALRSWEPANIDSWLVIGHALRLGVELGLHRHGYNSRLAEGDHELRRQLWWYVRGAMMDAELSGQYTRWTGSLRVGSAALLVSATKVGVMVATSDAHHSHRRVLPS